LFFKQLLYNVFAAPSARASSKVYYLLNNCGVEMWILLEMTVVKGGIEKHMR
jgi:hypothetical protein